ncbi:MAG: hypothetical protein V3U76_10010 [Granulosicoccus sp.]
MTLSRASALVASLALSSILASSCASTKPPVRPDYTGNDQVSAVSAGQLFGKWLVTSLNPYPGEGDQQTVIEYHSNGTVSGQITLQSEAAAALGSTSLTMSGDWSVDGDIVSHANISMEESSGSAMGALLSKMINSSSRNVAGSANIYELSDNRIVMVGSDGAAMQYIRQ